MKRSMRLAITLLAPALAAALGGCGYSFESTFPDNVKTVSVPVWQRGEKVFRRELEMQLTEAIVKQIELKTPYKVVSRASADTELTGTIDRVDQRVLSFNPDTGKPRDMEMTIYVTFTWKDLRTGKELAKRENFPVSGTYITSDPFSRDFFQGSQGVIDELAVRIVEQMEKPW